VLAYLARRLLLTVPVLLGVATLVFALIHFIPGDPARAILGDVASETDIAQLRQQLGLDRPLAVQYVAFLGGLARADLGTSLRTGTPVASQILERLPATFELALAAIAVALVVAIPLGIAAAVWRGTVVDHTAMTLSLAGVSMPNFWLGPLLAIVFAIELGWLPVSGRGTVFSFAVMHQVYHPGFAAEVPYAVVLVALDEGPRMISNVVGCATSAIRVGMPLEVVFEPVSPDVTLPKFRPTTR